MAESFGCPVFLGDSGHLEEQPQGDQPGFLMTFWASLFSVPSCSLPGHIGGDSLAPGLSLLLLEHYDAQQGADFL